MPKPGPAFLGIAILAAALLFHVAYAQSECAQFSIYTAESVQAEPGSSVNIDVAVTNTGTCAGETAVAAKVPDGWNSTSLFFTKKLGPGDSDPTGVIKITIPADAQTSTVEFMAESANSSFTEVIIEGSEAPAEPQNQTQAEPPVITPTPPIPITTPEAPAETPAETPAQPEPQAEQTAGDVTGLLTGNPAAQIAVFAFLFFGAGFLAGKMKSEGFRYRFRR
ncbi:MAG TPA: NEW3 domain-containing protein [archaeon]|nr:NEW3 domain-containing protein [archaeon]